MTAVLPSPRFDHFYRHDRLTALLFAYAEARPNIVSVRSIGKEPREGRDIWIVVLTNLASGADIDKPALWVDGNIHAAELTASTTCLYYLHQLVSLHGGSSPEAAVVNRLLDTRAIYLVPRLCPDGAELALADRPRHIRSSTRPTLHRRDGGRPHHRGRGRRRSHPHHARARPAWRLKTPPTRA